jgi:Ca2+-binding EF-hand superfamily protein
VKELKKVTTMLGASLTKEELEEFMKEADVVRKISHENDYYCEFCFQDGNGKLDYDEFVKMLLQY